MASSYEGGGSSGGMTWYIEYWPAVGGGYGAAFAVSLLGKYHDQSTYRVLRIHSYSSYRYWRTKFGVSAPASCCARSDAVRVQLTAFACDMSEKRGAGVISPLG